MQATKPQFLNYCDPDPFNSGNVNEFTNIHPISEAIKAPYYCTYYLVKHIYLKVSLRSTLFLKKLPKCRIYAWV